MKLLLQNIKSILDHACIKLEMWIWSHVVNVRIPSEMSVFLKTSDSFIFIRDMPIQNYLRNLICKFLTFRSNHIQIFLTFVFF